jgi:hypothetical protein
MEDKMKRTFNFPIMILGMVFLLLMASAIWAVTYAAPIPEAIPVNHQTRQCAEILTPGDECGGVILPPGWEYLEPGAACPDNYTLVDIDVGRYGYKDPDCCRITSFFGTHGDCQDVVIRDSESQCAFVDDIQNCPNLPDGWKAWGNYCPDEYKWVEEIACTEDEPVQPAIQTPTQIEPTTRKPLLPCLSAGLVLVILFGTKFRKP